MSGDWLRLMIERAVTKDEGAHLVSTVQLAADVVPGSEPQILAIVTRLAPERVTDVALALGLDLPEADAPAVAVAAPATAVPPPSFFSPSTWSGRIELGGSLNTGNTDEEAISDGRSVRVEVLRALIDAVEGLHGQRQVREGLGRVQA